MYTPFVYINISQLYKKKETFSAVYKHIHDTV